MACLAGHITAGRAVAHVIAGDVTARCRRLGTPVSGNADGHTATAHTTAGVVTARIAVVCTVVHVEPYLRVTPASLWFDNVTLTVDSHVESNTFWHLE